jgi:hypothetical protein
MEQRTTDPDHDLERSADELEERLDRLDGEIDESKKEAAARSAANEDPFDDADEDDAADDEDGDDPAGFDDPEADEDDEDDF